MIDPRPLTDEQLHFWRAKLEKEMMIMVEWSPRMDELEKAKVALDAEHVRRTSIFNGSFPGAR
jgi:hypothetical protein